MCDAAGNRSINGNDKLDDSRSFYERRLNCSSEDMPVLTPQTLCSAMARRQFSATDHYRKELSTKMLPRNVAIDQRDYHQKHKFSHNQNVYYDTAAQHSADVRMMKHNIGGSAQVYKGQREMPIPLTQRYFEDDRQLTHTSREPFHTKMIPCRIPTTTPVQFSRKYGRG